MRRPCEICGRDLPLMARRHKRTCSARCRQALSRRERAERERAAEEADRQSR